MKACLSLLCWFGMRRRVASPPMASLGKDERKAVEEFHEDLFVLGLASAELALAPA